MAPTGLLPSVNYLRACFIHNSNTGVLIWKHRPRDHFTTERIWAIWNTRYASKIAGTNQLGYRVVVINCRQYKIHRVIWKMEHGSEPPTTIDHKDGAKSDNRLDKLRGANMPQQMWNCEYKNKRAGRRGVVPNGKRWGAQIKENGVMRWLGTYDTIEDASGVYEAAARQLHGEFYRNR